MGWDEVSLVWQGGPPGVHLPEAVAALPPVEFTNNQQSDVGDGCSEKTVLSVPVHVRQLLFVNKTLVALTKVYAILEYFDTKTNSFLKYLQKRILKVYFI